MRILCFINFSLHGDVGGFGVFKTLIGKQERKNPMNMHSEIIKASNIPALNGDPVKLVLHLVQIPEKYHNDFLIALKIEAEATGKTTHCTKRECRKSGQCHAEHFNGIDHPCGAKWQMDTLRTILMMQLYEIRKAGIETDELNWW